MIRTKSSGYWSTGITLRYRDGYGNRPESWSGGLDFYDDGFLNDGPGGISTEGTLRTRYFVEGRPAEVALAAVIDTLIADAVRLGISFENSAGKPALYYAGDGTDEEFPPPEGWRHMLRMQADRIGWDSYRVDDYIDVVAFHLTRLGHEPAQWWTTTPDGEQLDGVIVFDDTANPELWTGRVWLGWDQRVGWSLCDDTRTLSSLGVGRYAAPEAVAIRTADRLTGRPDTVVDVGWDGAEALAEAVWKWGNDGRRG